MVASVVLDGDAVEGLDVARVGSAYGGSSSAPQVAQWALVITSGNRVDCRHSSYGFPGPVLLMARAGAGVCSGIDCDAMDSNA